ncbi:SagB/ThcOx family dehydrogenase [Haloferax profundi]|uniref:Nitroreductase domain-containing protein n=1 Tax=Haloferax profundi TaxID=1544718 RepID=A0A0W1RIR6_9EURY|nr:SagB/ThcOx family dehydrogenase [Haloferax profundi]KTG13375.1 hypothetical protein AUR66_19500 [Haloferax profundi]
MTIERPSRRTIVTALVLLALSAVFNAVFGLFTFGRSDDDTRESTTNIVSLPEANKESDVSVERAIANRRSRRTYDERPLTVAELGQLLWAAQGVTERLTGHRAAPSAGALYPIELYVVVGTGSVTGLEDGVYRYRPKTHELVLGQTGDVRSELRAAALDQDPVETAPVDIVVCSVDERTTQKYGDRGARRYVPMEAGHVGENIYLQAESLRLSTVSIGAFGDQRVADIVGAPEDQRPLYIFPVGARI